MRSPLLALALLLGACTANGSGEGPPQPPPEPPCDCLEPEPVKVVIPDHRPWLYLYCEHPPFGKTHQIGYGWLLAINEVRRANGLPEIEIPKRLSKGDAGKPSAACVKILEEVVKRRTS